MALKSPICLHFQSFSLKKNTLFYKVLNRVKKDKKELEKLWGNLKILIGELFGMIVNML